MLYYIGTLIIILIIGMIARHYMSFRQWLIFACTQAENILGSATGQLKLKYVYNLAIHTFPFLSRLITFSHFSKLIDLALDAMKEMLENNEAISHLVQDSDRQNSTKQEHADDKE